MLSFFRRKSARTPRKNTRTPKPVARRLFRFDGPTMGTRYSVTCVIPEDLDAEALKAEAHKAVDLVDCQMSTWKPESPLSRFNSSAPGEWFEVPAPLAHVVESGLRISRDTKGAFDMTVGHAVNRWGFGPQQQPRAEGATPRQQAIGYSNLEVRIDPPALRKSADCYVDLSGIAKGFGVDCIAEALEAHGITDYLVVIDGEVRLRGRKPGPDSRWVISVDAPIPGERQVWDVLRPPDGALATSGDYRHFFVENGKTYAHTIDARTGRPLENAVASVTVFQPDCMSADALATALLVLGPKAGVTLAQARNIPALFLIRKPDGMEDVMTGGFRDMLDNELQSGLVPVISQSVRD